MPIPSSLSALATIARLGFIRLAHALLSTATANRAVAVQHDLDSVSQPRFRDVDTDCTILRNAEARNRAQVGIAAPNPAVPRPANAYGRRALGCLRFAVFAARFFLHP